MEELSKFIMDNLVVILPVIVGLANTLFGFFKSGKRFDLNALLGVFVSFRSDFKKIQDRYYEQVSPKKIDQKEPSEEENPPVPDNIKASKFLKDSPGKKILRVRYNSQRDNRYSPSSACNVTAAQMPWMVIWTYPMTPSGRCVTQRKQRSR